MMFWARYDSTGVHWGPRDKYRTIYNWAVWLAILPVLQRLDDACD